MNRAGYKSFGHNLSLRFIKILNLVMISLPFEIVWFGYYSKHLWMPFYRMRYYFVVAGIFVVLYFVFARVYEAFLISYTSVADGVYSQMLAAGISDTVMFMIIYLLTRKMPNVIPIILAVLLQILMAALWNASAKVWYFHTFKARSTAVIWDMREGLDKLIDDYGLKRKFDVVKNSPASECVSNLGMLDDVDIIFISGVHSHDRNIIIKYAVMKGKKCFIIPRIGDVMMSGARTMHMFHLPMMRLTKYAPPVEYNIMKRLSDIIVSLLAIVILSPIFIITAIAVASDGGPVLYKQKRLTKDGKEFYVKKFRSMRVDAEKDGVARLSTGDKDDRITKVGRFIRKVRIDELPQLLNILEGDMSLIGPRPERPEIAAKYEKDMPEFSLRLQAKAGLTGYAQVFGKYNTTPYDKLQMDLMYIAHPSVIEDIKILFATIKILFLPESTEGVEEGKTTAGD